MSTLKSRKGNRNSVFSGYVHETMGRESVNSFDESSVKNSQSGTTDGGISTQQNNKNSYNMNNRDNKPSYMESTETLNRSSNKRETLHSRFEFIKVLGKGTYGKVKLANDKRTGKQVNFDILFATITE
jgi:hypothetical protein